MATAASMPLACDSDTTTACFNIAAEGANITHILVDAACAASPSDFAITVDGVDGMDVIMLHTDGGPGESIPRDVWFPLPSNQDEALVCVSVQAAGPEGIRCMPRLRTIACRDHAVRRALTASMPESPEPGGASGRSASSYGSAPALLPGPWLAICGAQPCFCL